MTSTDSSSPCPIPPSPVPPRPPARDDIGCVGCLGLAFIFVLSIPCLGVVALFGPEVWNDIWHKGSATGPAAVERAATLIGEIDGGRWKSAAANARAEWARPGFSSDGYNRFGFDLPADELARFERAVSATAGPPVPVGAEAGGPVWYAPVGPHGVRLTVDRRAGRVSVDAP